MQMTVPYKQIFLFWVSIAALSFGQHAVAEPNSVTPAVENNPAPGPEPLASATPADPLERRVGEIVERTTKIHAGEATRATEAAARHAQRRAELASLREQLNVALSMPPASSAKTEQIDQTWFSLRNLVRRLQDDRFQALDALETAKSDRARVNPEAIGPYNNNDKIRDAMDGFSHAHDARVSAVEEEIDATSILLDQTRNLRRTARRQASQEALLSIEQQRLEEIKSEIVSIPLDLRSSVRQIHQAWWKSPDELSQFQALGALFLGLMELAFLLVIGMWTHSQTPLWTRRLMAYFEPDKDTGSWAGNQRFPSWMVAGDLRSLAAPLASLLQDILVLGVSFTIIVWLSDPLPLVAWIAIVFAAGACVRGAQGVVELALITPSENRPGLRVTAPEARKACLWLIQYFGMLKVIEVVVVHLLVVILGADHVGELFSETIHIVTWLLVALALFRWGDFLRSRVKAGGTDSALARWVFSSGTSKIQGVFGALFAVVILFVRFLVDVAQGLIDRRGGLAWLRAILARRQLRDSIESVPTPLPASLRRAIVSGALKMVPLEDKFSLIQEKRHAWQQDPRRGLLTITGDRGAGKNVLMDQLAARLDGPIIQAVTPIGHTQANAALKWLAGIANIEHADSSEELIGALKKLPPSTFLLSNLNRLFLRAVGHYQGLDSALEVMQATGRHHFWIASIHSPAWSFLHGMSDVGHVNVFAHHIHLGPTSPADLSQWLEAQTRKGGVVPRFDGLLNKPNNGPDQARMIERAERAYWRLLTDASQGNPSVAIRLWMDSLRPTSNDDGEAFVGLFSAHNTEELEELRDDELFALTALILHDDLTVSDLHIVLNQPEASVRALCRGLEQRTLITETDAGRYKVRMNWLPAVERHLQRRSFMHKS